MGMDVISCRLLQKALPAPAVLSLGYPDILIDNAKAEEMFGVRLIGIHPQNEDAKNRHHFDGNLIDTDEFFREMGSVLTCVDYKVLRGNEVVADLNVPCDLGDFDLVIDPGTLEHCFNLPQAAVNVVMAVKPGGRVIHCNPVTAVNHGFYMLSPTWYLDWYHENGFEIEELWISDGKAVEKPDPIARFHVKPECWMHVLAKKVESKPLKWPIQSKYLMMQGA